MFFFQRARIVFFRVLFFFLLLFNKMKDLTSVAFRVALLCVTVFVVIRFLRGRELTVTALCPHAKLSRLPQLQHYFSDLRKGYRTYNPTISFRITRAGATPIITCRVSNYTLCSTTASNASYYLQNAAMYYSSGGGGVDNHLVVLVNGVAKRLRVLQEGNAEGAEGCVKGFEDPRTLVQADRLLVFANRQAPQLPGPAKAGHSDEAQACVNQMWMLTVPLRDVYQLNEIRVKTAVRLRSPSGKVRVEKNWMPFFTDDGVLHFVYSVNPHVVIRCNELTGVTTEVARTYNKLIDHRSTPIRGGSQVVKYAGHYLAFTHSRDHNHYRTQLYAFSPRHPFEVTHMSRSFMFSEARDVDALRIQFVAGFEVIGDVAYITYGEQDCSACVCVVPMRELLNLLRRV